ncbi:MAG: hypothetical protein JXR94_24705 [Candidatus Hydrogenedentes bacterium]|nr:hypothetical protein [Candidatus Hydrogenedentota bacterium]
MNLVLGAAQRLNLGHLKPFCFSLLRAGFEGMTALFVSDIDEQTRYALTVMGVHLIEPEAGAALDQAGINSSRYLVYRRFLESLGDSVTNVMLTDVRDVLFQRDPFDFARDDALCCFLEDPSVTLKSCPHNAIWFLNAYGSEALTELGDHRVSCSGTTIGPAWRIREYTARITGELLAMSRRKPGITQALAGVDQAAHNYLIRTGQLEGVRLFENGSGPVLTLGHVEPEAIRFTEDGYVADAAGGAVNVLHQYDRHPELARRLVDRFG